MASQTKAVKLKVLEALSEDAYKGLVRIGVPQMKTLGIKPGDFLSIKGERETVAIADRVFPSDVGEPIIRMDGIIRKNAKVGWGDIVTIDTVHIKEAKKIIIAPVQKGIRVQAETAIFGKGLIGRPVTAGDIVVLGGARRKRDIPMDALEEDIFNLFGEAINMSFGQFNTTRFWIVETTPKGAVFVSDETDFTLSPVAMPMTAEDKEMQKILRGKNGEEITPKWDKIQIIQLKKLPSLDNFYEVKNVEEFNKLLSSIRDKIYLHIYEDDKKKYFLVANYYYAC